MWKRTAAVIAGALILTVPMVLPAGAQIPAPGPEGMGMNMGGSTPPTMSITDMLKMQVHASQRIAAANQATSQGRPSMTTAKSTMNPGGVPDYFGASPNYATSPLPHIKWAVAMAGHNVGDDVVLPVIDPTTGILTDPSNSNAVVAPADSPYQTTVDSTGATVVVTDPINGVPQLDLSKVSVSGGIRKFIEPLPGVGAPDPNSTVKNCAVNDLTDPSCTTSYLPIAVPDTTTYPGSDYYVIGLKDYYQQFSPDLPLTRLRGYYQINAPGGEMKPYYMGPIIMAKAGRPVRIKFINNLPTGTDGNLFLPVDTTAMGAGLGPLGAAAGNYNQNRATLHLHGGLTPWISDGTPHQWTTPAGDTTAYPEGVSVHNVPDMNGGKEPQGTLTFYYTNQQSARLMFYHDHSYGITRLNVYAGEAAGYMISDNIEKEMVMGTAAYLAANPGAKSHFANQVAPETIPSTQIPLVIQDKTFVPDNTPSGYFPNGQLAAQDPTWDTSKWSGTGGLWFPHVYMPNQNPYDDSGVAPMGRWDYGPWFWPIFGTSAGLQHGEVPNPYANASSPWEPPMIPGVPSVSMTPESFVDTPIVNGLAYPYLNVDPKAYRLRILNAANDRTWNLQLYCAVSNAPMWNANGTLNDANAGEVPMVPAVKTKGFPIDWPTDGRDGGVPNPAARATNFLQIGNESGFLPNLNVVRNGPIGYNYNRRDIVVLNVQEHALLLGPAQRADVVVDFSHLPAGCSNVILYNDGPAPIPGFDPRLDYYTNSPDQTSSGGAPSTLPGYGPDTRTIMQFRVNQSATPAPAFDVNNLATVLPQAFAAGQPKPIVPEKAFANAYPNDIIGATNNYSRIQNNSLSFPANIAPISVNVINGGGGYLNGTPNVVISGPGSGAVATPVFSTAGTLTGFNITKGGKGYSAASPPTLAVDPPTAGTQASGVGVITNGRLTGYQVSNPGSGYFTPTVTIDPPGGSGTPAQGTAIVTGGVVTGITLTNPGSGYTTAPNVTIAPSSGGTATAAASLANVTVPLQPKTIQELFEMNYGRMNATLGVELPFTNSNIQTTLPMGYAEPATEIMSPSQVGTQLGTLNNGVQIWKITHNGVDTHFIHFHLFDVQVINRVGWDGAIRPPDPSEVGWNDTVRMNPLEDTIVAMRPVVPVLPFKIPDSIRSIDPTLPASATIASFDPTTGQAIRVSNQPMDFGWEYVWHCHILGHEENDMMRPVIFTVAPTAPTIGHSSSPPSSDGSPQIVIPWTNNANWQLTNFVIQRATDPNFTQNLVQTTSGKVVAPYVAPFGSYIPASATSFTDTSVTDGVHYYYRMRAESDAGYSDWTTWTSQIAHATPPRTPTTLRPAPILQTSAIMAWNESTSPVAPMSFTLQYSTTSDFSANVTTLPTIAGSARQTLVTGLTPNTTYYWRIQATNNGGSSAWSTVLKAKTQP